MIPNDRARPSAADQNVERLLRSVYAPERPDPDFAQRVTAQMLAAARRRTQAKPYRWFQHPRTAWGLAAAVFVALTFGALSAMNPPQRPSVFDPIAAGEPEPRPMPVIASPTPRGQPERLTVRPRNPVPEANHLAVGETAQTTAGQRRRFVLPDGSVLFLNEKTDVTLTAQRRLRLDAGEVYVEVAPRKDDPFKVATSDRHVAALGTRFAVQAEKAGTGVVVTQGRVKVEGLADLVRTGEQVLPGARAIASAPRVTHVLGWMEDLVAEAGGGVVPVNPKAGGAIVIKDSYGRDTSLSLRKYHVDVHIEDGFARTTIDQTYFNHEHRRLEGTFHFPLPPDASLSRLAMYVNGKLMEGGMAERAIARAIYEGIVRKMQDPALLEWVDGSTFKMRVFPLEPRQEKRIVISYTQKLSGLYGDSTYRFPAGHSLEAVRDWSFHATVKHGAKLGWNCSTHDLKAVTDKGDLLLDTEAKHVKVDRDVVLELHEESATERETRFTSAVLDGSKYLMLRYRPKLPGAAKKQRRDWVILFESSADRDPVLARTQVEIVRGLLTNAEHDDTFAILTAGATPTVLTDKALPASPANLDAALAKLEQAHLVGALDLKQSLLAAESFLKSVTSPYLVHVGSGLPVLGEKRTDELLKLLPEGTRYVGVGVGKRWNRAFMKSAADRSGGYFTQINPDEKVSWRAFDLLATLNTPRLLDVKVTDKAGRVMFLTQQSALAQGEELAATGCTGTEADKLPDLLVVAGTLDGKAFRREIAVKDVADNAGYIPRTWARLEIDRLLAENAEGNKDRIVALSKAMYVMTPYTSLLVLENEEMYRQYNVDRGRKDHWAMYPCPQTIPVVTEPTDGLALTAKDSSAKVTSKDVLESLLYNGTPLALWQQSRSTAYFSLSDAKRLENQNLDVGLNPEVQLNFNVDRIEDVSILGVVDPTQAVGIPGGAPADPAGIPAPAGLGGGIGGGMESTLGGRGIAGLAPGGMGGISAMPGGFGGRSGATRESIFANGGGFGRSGYFPMPQPVTINPGVARPFSDTPVTRQWRDLDQSEWFFRSLPSLRTYSEKETETLKKLNDLLRHQQTIRAFTERSENESESGRSKVQTWSETSRFENLLPKDGYRTISDFDLSPVSEVKQRISRDETTRILNLPENNTWGRSALDAWLVRLANGDGRPVTTYQRPTFHYTPSLWTNLLAHAPGLGNSSADAFAALEAEVSELRPTLGRIDPEAELRLRRARAVWRSVTVNGVAITFDGAGWFSWERTLPLGLKEIVVCDRYTLLHLYPELGLGARRSMTAFHRAELNALVPWVLPPAEDLARGADIKAVGKDTVAVIPTHKDATHHLHLVFGADYRLAERRVIETKTNKVIARETYTNGVVQRFDASGKEVSSTDLSLRPASAPSVTPDTNGLVLLNLPLRSRAHLLAKHGVNDQTVHTLKSDVLIQMLASAVAAGEPHHATHAVALLTQRSDFRPGLWTLLLSAGGNPNEIAMPAAVQHTPIGRYIAWVAPSESRDWNKIGDLEDGLLRNLALFAGLTQSWSADTSAVSGAEATRLTRFVAEAQSPVLSWIVLDAVLRSSKRPVTLPGGLLGLKRRLVEEAVASLAKHPTLADAARYEQALLSLEAKDPTATKQFTDLYAKAFEEGRLPLVEATFRKALGENDAVWAMRTRRTLARLMERKDHVSALALAWQCWDLGDRDLADEIVEAVQAKKPAGSAALPYTLAALEFYRHTGRPNRADQLLEGLLTDSVLTERPLAWRLGAKLAAERKQPVRTAERLDRALALEHQQSAVLSLEQIRQDYTLLLNTYEQQARAWNVLQQKPSADFADRVVAAVDRWRSLDDANVTACHTASRILRLVGRPELAWEYLSTTLNGPSAEPSAVLELARSLVREGERDVAELAYRAANDAGLAGVADERIMNLEQAGRFEEVRRLRESKR